MTGKRTQIETGLQELRMKSQQARAAHDSGNVEASRRVHAQHSAVQTEEQWNNLFASGRLAKLSIEGGIKGATMSFVLMGASSGAELDWGVLRALGGGAIVAHTFAIVCGRYLAERADFAWVRKEREREAWELRHNPEGEKEEMVEIYTSPKHGLSQPDATAMVDIMAKYPHFFVDVMMVHELAIDPAKVDLASRAAAKAKPQSLPLAQRCRKGAAELAALCLSFAIASAAPLVCSSPSVVAALVGLAASAQTTTGASGDDAAAGWSLLHGASVAIVVLTVLGSLRSRASRNGSLMGGVLAMFFGCVAAGIALALSATLR